MGRDEQLMRRAIALARAGTGATYPNPCVGAVVARRGRVVAAARTGAVGDSHAEVRALRKAGSEARGATLYVTLEPCAHHGRTPPCVDAILEHGVARVVYGVSDPAEHARGRGPARLHRRSVTVDAGVLGDQCRDVHLHYLHHIDTGRPYVTLKAAISLDGRIAAASGQSRWITGEPARRHAHRLRARHHGIAVGADTVLSDNPALTVRHVRGLDPVVVVFDTGGRVARSGRALEVLRAGTIVVHGPQASRRTVGELEKLGCIPVRVRTDANGRASVRDALRALGRRGLRSLLVEGGGTLHGSFVAAKAWNRLELLQAPRLLGEGPSWLSGLAYRRVGDAPQVRVVTRRKLGDDELIVCEPRA